MEKKIDPGSRSVDLKWMDALPSGKRLKMKRKSRIDRVYSILRFLTPLESEERRKKEWMTLNCFL